jgi:hypothetical protein
LRSAHGLFARAGQLDEIVEGRHFAATTEFGGEGLGILLEGAKVDHGEACYHVVVAVVDGLGGVVRVRRGATGPRRSV